MRKRIRVDFSRLRAGDRGYDWDHGDRYALLGLANRMTELLSDLGSQVLIVSHDNDNCTVDLEVSVDFEKSSIKNLFDLRAVVTDLEDGK
ncbi:MAG: hypothetical protein HY225_03280 [Candidatus Vogelbacteria bacterium]|nr:hypothetical protein [Candidatus Vogelbacteria bacterium]